MNRWILAILTSDVILMKFLIVEIFHEVFRVIFQESEICEMSGLKN